jgi:hypothetical protein
MQLLSVRGANKMHVIYQNKWYVITSLLCSCVFLTCRPVRFNPSDAGRARLDIGRELLEGYYKADYCVPPVVSPKPHPVERRSDPLTVFIT